MKSILNSIFHEDSNVLKILADKKVYENEETESNKSTQDNASNVVEMKQNML